MINAVFFITNSGSLVGFEIKGHSDRDFQGQDIICAAVSSAAYMTANTISDVIFAEADIHDNEDGFMFVRVSEKFFKDCHTVLLGFKLHMINLEEQYPNNITVNYLEV